MQVADYRRLCRPVGRGITVFALLAFISSFHPESFQAQIGGSVHTRHVGSLRFAAATPKPAVPAAPKLPKLNDIRLPFSFEPNLGQAPGPVRFVARGAGYTLFLTSDEAVLALKSGGAGSRGAGGMGNTQGVSPEARKIAPVAQEPLRMKLLGESTSAAVSGADRLPGAANYLIGNNPRTWRTHIPTYAQVAYRNVYPGVDLVYYGRAGQLEYDFRVRPGASPRAIRLAFAGARRTRVTAGGDLALRISGGEVRLRKPAAYQLDASGARHVVTSSYALKTCAAENGRRTAQVAFRVGAYDRSRTLVIDPSLSFSTYLGGAGTDSATGVAVDAGGDVYLTGQTASLNFPVKGAYQASNGGGTDAFVAKISADGKSELYATYLGGSGSDSGAAIAVDAAGEAFVTGNTSSTNFPTTPGSRQTANAGGVDAFVTRLDATGATPVYSAYLGGTGDDYGYAIAVDSSDNAYVAGSTTSVDFPATKGAYQTKNGGGTDAFLDEIPAAGTAPSIYATYLGGAGTDTAYGVALDSSNNVYVTGQTGSTNFPVSASALQATSGGATDAFVAEFIPSASANASLVYSTYLGGGGDDSGFGIAVDGSANAYVAGSTTSMNFPTTSGVLQPDNNGGKDAFIAEVLTGGAALAYSTYLGGSGDDSAAAVAVDGSGNAFVTGNTKSANFPTVAALQSVCAIAVSAGCDDAFASEVSPGATALSYSTFLGGSMHEAGAALALDGSGDAYIAGATASTDFPATSGAFQTSCGSTTACGNAFLAKIASASAPLQALPSVVPFGVETIGIPSAPQTVTVANTTGSTVTFTGIVASSGFEVSASKTTCLVTSPLSNNASCSIGVTFTPGASGQQLGTLTLTDSASGSPQVVNLSGIGVTSVVTLTPDVVAFGNQFVGTSSAPQAVTLVNSGSTSLEISSISVTASSAFTQTNNCGTSLDAGQSCTIDVIFTPKATGTASAILTVSDSASGSPQTASLTGSGVSPTVSLSATTLNFGSQVVNSLSATPQSVTVTNTGNANLSVTAISISGANAADFLLATGTPCGASIAAGGSCTIPVNFKPSGADARSATLSIADNAANSPQTVALTGTGSDFQLASSPTSASLSPGGSTTYTLTVTPLGGFTGTVNLTCSGAPSGASCGLSLPSATFTTGGSPVKVTVNVATTAPGSAPPAFRRLAPPRGPLIPPGVVWVILAGLLAIVGLAHARTRRACVMLAGAALLAVLVMSCGNTVKTKPTAGTPFGTYTLTLTGSSSNIGHSTTVSLVVN